MMQTQTPTQTPTTTRPDIGLIIVGDEILSGKRADKHLSKTIELLSARGLSLDWADNTEPDLSEYGVYRNTTGVTPPSAASDKIAEVRASRFVDTEVAIGTTYYYWVNAYDMLENVSGFSNRATAVPTYVSGGSVDPNAPTTPAAPQYVSETTYLASDGGSFARISLTAPPLSANAIATDILYRRSGANDWILGNQINSAVSYLVSIDDLTCGVTYEFASRAISNFGVLSSVSTTISRMAPNNTTAPADPTNVVVTSPSTTYPVPPRYTGAGAQAFAAYVFWDASTTRSVVGYQVGYSPTYGGAITWEDEIIPQTSYYHYTLNTLAQYISIRAVDRSGNNSTGVSVTTSLATVIKIPAGTISSQDSDAVDITGGDLVQVVLSAVEISSLTVPLAIADGGTDAATASDARANLLPTLHRQRRIRPSS